MARKRSPTVGPYLLHLELLREKVPSFDVFPYCVPVLAHLTKLAFHPKVTFFIGENGSGKSLLMEALAVEMRLNPEGGSRNFNFATNETHAKLQRTLRIARRMTPEDSFFLRAESFYNVATEVERLGVGNSYGGKSLHAQSHGEAFFATFKHRMDGNGLYLMDEPEAALSPRRQLEFLALLHQFCEAGAQFVIATHSPILMAYPHATHYEFGPEGIREVAYTDTDHYRITRSFLANPQRTLEVLFADE